MQWYSVNVYKTVVKPVNVCHFCLINDWWNKSDLFKVNFLSVDQSIHQQIALVCKCCSTDVRKTRLFGAEPKKCHIIMILICFSQWKRKIITEKWSFPPNENHIANRISVKTIARLVICCCFLCFRATVPCKLNAVAVIDESYVRSINCHKDSF